MDTYSLLLILIIIFILVAFLISIIMFLKTPKEERTLAYVNQKKTEYLHKKLLSYPKEYEATLIKGNKKEAFLSSLPYILYFLLSVIITSYVTKNMYSLPCTEIFEINIAVILIVIAFIAIPLGFFALLLSGVKMGIEVYKTGFFPPLNSVHFDDKIAIKTTFSKIKGIFLIISPVMFLLGSFYIYFSFVNMSDGNFFKLYEDKIKKSV